MKNLHFFKNPQGFTLIETLVALAIFAIGIIAAYTMQVHSSKSSGRANSISTSSTWATYLVEELLVKPIDDDAWKNDYGDPDNGLIDIDDTNGGPDAPDGQMHIQPDSTVSTLSTAAAGSLYSVYWNIADNSPLEGVKQIRIKVIKNNGLNVGELYSQDYFKISENL